MDGNMILDPARLVAMPTTSFCPDNLTRSDPYNFLDTKRRAQHTTAMHDWICANQLTIPATTFKVPRAEAWTWRRKGRKRAIDHFFLGGVDLQDVKEHRVCSAGEMMKVLCT